MSTTANQVSDSLCVALARGLRRMEQANGIDSNLDHKNMAFLAHSRAS